MRSFIEFEYAYKVYKEALAAVAPGAWSIRVARCQRCGCQALTYREGRVVDDNSPAEGMITVKLYCPKCGHKSYAQRNVEG